MTEQTARSVSAPDGAAVAPPATEPELVLRAREVFQEFSVKGDKPFQRATVSAVAGVDLDIARGETHALVGETGSGKSTLARALLGAPVATSGTITIGDRIVPTGRGRATRNRSVGSSVQMVYQDPYGALDPRWTIARSIAEPLVTAGITSTAERRRRVAEMMHLVGLSVSRFGGRLPRELSGGQAQRVAIARALVAEPDLLILDEPVTALDVSVQAQILHLLYELKQQLGLTSLLIAHDLAVVRALAERTSILFLGRMCESGPTDEIFTHPRHPYTAALLSAIPPGLRGGAKRERIEIVGRQPSPLNPPSGCRFRTRCVYAQDVCAEVVPQMTELSTGHQVACHFPLEVTPAAS